MVLLLALPVFAAVALVPRYLQLYAPSNLLVRRVRIATPRLRVSAGLLAVAATLLIAMHIVTVGIAAGAPGWLNLVVLVLAWDAIKVGLLALLTAARVTLRAIRLALPERSASASQCALVSAGRLVDRTRVRETVGHAPR